MELDGLPPTVMPTPAVTLIFDLPTLKPSQYVSRPRYICDLILVKLAPIVMKIFHSHGFLGHHLP